MDTGLLLSEKPIHLLSDEMIGWFGSRKLFIDFQAGKLINPPETDFPADQEVQKVNL